MSNESGWIIPAPTPGRLVIVPRPRGGDWLADEIAGWRRAGVGVAVSLLTAEEANDLAAEATLCGSHGVRFESLPIPDCDVPNSTSAVSDLAERLIVDLAAGRTVAIHCRQGIGRSALVAASVLTLLGVDAADAVGRIASARGRPVPETPEQSAWIMAFARKHATDAGI
jgi:protein-tyrosine phosphatase